MFGYIRPMQGELRVRELERFKACYCGLCHALGKRYGFSARFILSYEFVLLAMLLWQDEPLSIMRGRCIASPCRKKRFCERSAALDAAAGYSVILTWWKLRDSIEDEPGVKAIPHRLLSFILKGAYRKAVSDHPEFDGIVRQQLINLTEYESSSGNSLDGAADKFAQTLKATVSDNIPEPLRRPLIEILYHLGRWVYIIDAFDDYHDDSKANRYNPVAARFSQDGCGISGDSKARLMSTLTHSNNLICSAFELMPENIWTEIVRNLIYLGMPDACTRVLEGKWPPRSTGRGPDI